MFILLMTTYECHSYSLSAVSYMLWSLQIWEVKIFYYNFNLPFSYQECDLACFNIFSNPCIYLSWELPVQSFARFTVRLLVFLLSVWRVLYTFRKLIVYHIYHRFFLKSLFYISFLLTKVMMDMLVFASLHCVWPSHLSWLLSWDTHTLLFKGSISFTCFVKKF